MQININCKKYKKKSIMKKLYKSKKKKFEIILLRALTK